MYIEKAIEKVYFKSNLHLFFLDYFGIHHKISEDKQMAENILSTNIPETLSTV